MPKAKGKTKEETFSLYRLASGKPGIKVSVAQYLEIVSRDRVLKTHKVTYKLKDGYVYHGSSQEEIRVIKRLEKHDAFRKLRGQCLCIPYRFGGKNRRYYPDFVVLTKTGKVVIIEVKPIADMATKQNLKKYKALAKYCKQHGYLYLMCDKLLRPYSKVKEEKRHGKVERAIKHALEDTGRFTAQDYKTLIEGKSARDVRKIRDRIGAYVAAHEGEVRQVGNLEHEMKRFVIVKA